MTIFEGHSNIEICWFTAKFGLIEGTILTIFGFVMTVITSLTFIQVSMSTLFAMFFMITYGVGFFLKKQQASA